MQGDRARRRELLPLNAALAAFAAPRRLLVVGRAGVGKTSWCNAVSGRTEPKGLGGVTDTIVAHTAPDGTVLFDTPGLDRPGAVAQIAAVAGEVDGVVWIVDGLAPVGAAERDDVAALRGDAPLAAIIGRGDLVPVDEHDEVRERVRLRAGVAAPIADLRRGPFPPIPALPVAPRRIRALRVAAEAARAAKVAEGPPPSPDLALRALRDAWHARVREADRIADPVAWRRAVAALPDAFLADLDAWRLVTPPGRPALPTHPTGPRKTAAARLAIDGDVALTDWFAEIDPAEADRPRLAAIAALDRLLAKLERPDFDPVDLARQALDEGDTALHQGGGTCSSGA